MTEPIVTGASLQNIAEKGEASQIDDARGRDNIPLKAKLAIDGKTSGLSAWKSIAQTITKGPGAWWKLVFTEWFYIGYIKIYNRDDCCKDGMIGVRVAVGGTLLPTEGTREKVSYWPNINMSAWHLEVRGGSSGLPLSLAEVEVYGIASSLSFFFRGEEDNKGVMGEQVRVKVDNTHNEDICFSSFDILTAKDICKMMGYSDHAEIKPNTDVSLIENSNVRYINDLKCIVTLSLHFCHYSLATECHDGAMYITCTCKPNEYWKLESCAKCPVGIASTTDRNNCNCTQGTYFTASTSSCDECEVGTYNDRWGVTECVSCPLGSTSGTGAASCYCVGGFYRSDYEICEPCPLGYYSYLGEETCTKCPENATSARFQSSCSCLSGEYWNFSSRNCIKCAGETYSTFNSTSCTTCTLGSGKRKGIDCNCRPGYIWNNNLCTKCDEGFVSYSGALNCSPCPKVYDPAFEQACPTKSRFIYNIVCTLVVVVPLICTSVVCWYQFFNTNRQLQQEEIPIQ